MILSIATLTSTIAFADVATEKCIEAKVTMREKIEQKTFDPVHNSYATIIPGYEEQIKKELADPYSCSLAWTKNKKGE